MLKPNKILFLCVVLFSSLLGQQTLVAADRETDFNTHTGTNGPDPYQDNEPPPSSSNSCNATTSPVYIYNRQFFWRDVDVDFPGRPDLRIARTYNSFDGRDGVFGKGWTEVCERSLLKVYLSNSETNEEGGSGSSFQYIYRAANGRVYTFEFNGSGFVAPDGLNSLRLNEIAEGGAEIVALSGRREIYNAQGLLIQELDNNSNALNYSYQEGALTNIQDEHGRFLTLTYDASGHVASVTDHTNRIWSYAYDERGALVSVTNPEGGVRSYEYETFVPEASGASYLLLTKIIDASGVIITSVEYDNEGKVTSYTEGENRYTYIVNNNYTTKRDSVSSEWLFLVDESGLRIEEYDPLGNLTKYSYDEQGNVTLKIDPLDTIFTYEYDKYGRLISATTPDGKTLYEFEGQNLGPASIMSPSGRTTDIVYDEHNNILSFTDPAGNMTLFEYAANGDLNKISNALNEVVNFSFTATGLVSTATNEEGQTTQFDYDARGNLVKVINAKDEATQFGYDLLDRMTFSTDPLLRTTIYTYDEAGRLLSVTTPNNESVIYEYDPYGRLVIRKNFDGVTESYSYRTDNLIATYTDRAGVTTKYTYDAAKRLTHMDKGAAFTSYSYDKRSQLVSIQNETGTVTFSYDAMGRPIQETNIASVNYDYNEEGELVGQSALGRQIDYSYDVRGLLSQLSVPGGVFDFTYDALGRRSGLTYPSGDTTSYQFDSIGQLTAQTHTGSFSASYLYEFDDANRLTQWQGDGVNKTYQYDDAGEVISVVDNFGSYTFNYDEIGNRISDNGIFDAANRLLENETYSFSYDGNGNLIEKVDNSTGKRIVYGWNERNQLVQLNHYSNSDTATPDSTTQFSYGPLERRWSRTKDGVTQYFAYSGMDRIATLDDNLNPQTHFDFGPDVDEPLVIEQEDNSYYYFSDYLGSIRAVTDGSVIVSSYDYSAFGRTSVSGDETLNPFLYTGREYEGNNLYYYRARYYDSNIGRFISSDTEQFAADNGNFYRYVFNNPINFVDPTGFVGEPAGWPDSYPKLPLSDDDLRNMSDEELRDAHKRLRKAGNSTEARKVQKWQKRNGGDRNKRKKRGLPKTKFRGAGPLLALELTCLQGGGPCEICDLFGFYNPRCDENLFFCPNKA